MKLLLDTNVIIDFLKRKTLAFDISSLLLEHECLVSVIVKLELLKYPDISVEEEQNIRDFLQFVPVVQLNEAIEEEAIRISRSTRLKLPDAIIGATAIIYGAEIVTGDPHFLNCRHEKLRIWERPS
ncbi:MAG: type II toxin-antitoxin system VapC family toxin [Spirochaetes bacterium]|nr:type II toxin-antitoxin system VapC family toxin [Spirochaetota bacterium]